MLACLAKTGGFSTQSWPRLFTGAAVTTRDPRQQMVQQWRRLWVRSTARIANQIRAGTRASLFVLTSFSVFLRALL